MNNETHSATQTEATDYTDVDELLELVEQLHLRQEQSERTLRRVTRELDIIKRRNDDDDEDRATGPIPSIPSSEHHNRRLQIGDVVRVNSKHRNRQGTIGTVTAYRGKTQVVISTSENNSFSVWTHNVSVLRKTENKC